MRFPRQRGSTSVMVRVFIPDNTSATGAGLTGLTSASTNLAIAYSRELQNGFTQITGANIATITTIGTWANPGTGKLGFKAVDATNAPGLYEIQFPDDAAAFGTSDTSQALYINVLELTTTALKIGPNMVLIPLVPWNYQDGVRMGMTALPNAAANAAGGLPVSIAGALDLDEMNTDIETIETRVVLALPAVAPAASGGLPTTDGAKLNQTVDLTATQIQVKKNTQLANFTFPMYSNSDHATLLSGLTVTATRSIDGATFGSCANPVSEIGTTGVYKITLAAADLNGTVIALKFAAANADTLPVTIITQA